MSPELPNINLTESATESHSSHRSPVIEEPPVATNSQGNQSLYSSAFANSLNSGTNGTNGHHQLHSSNNRSLTVQQSQRGDVLPQPTFK